MRILYFVGGKTANFPGSRIAKSLFWMALIIDKSCLQRVDTAAAELVTLMVGVGERIGEEHYAFSFRTMVQAIGMSELMYSLCQCPAHK